MSHGQNLSSTTGQPEFVAQYFFEIPFQPLDKSKTRVTASPLVCSLSECIECYHIEIEINKLFLQFLLGK
jgi:hypothetical protein